ncbi:MAG: hypothetical protein D6765_08960 [Bacteroidetes bacterium]|nr:MAG: hypothetical protein D6765_08960 [Bacteroidota bacterium]
MKAPLVLFTLLPFFAVAQESPLLRLLEENRDSFATVLAQPERFEVQILYTQIDRDADNQPRFRTFSYGLDPQRYFYPASTVKMPTAFAALEKLNRLRILGLDRNTPLKFGAGHPPQTPLSADSTAPDGLPSVAHLIRKVFLVSDNEAHNRLYEFLGQEALNRTLHEKGFTNLRILHRLGASGAPFDFETNRYTNPVSFYRNDTLLYHQGEVYSACPCSLELQGEIKGIAHIDRQGKLVHQPFDFRRKNFIGLQELHELLRVVLFPEAFPPECRFDLSEEDYRFLYAAMSALPRESRHPRSTEPDNYVKFFLFGDRDSTFRIPGHLRIFNKVGWAYGYLTDVAYVVDFQNGVEFLLAATIHVNANQTYNDGVYEYEEVGLPFLARLGRLIYRYELQRPRPRKPDLSRFKVHPAP